MTRIDAAADNVGIAVDIRGRGPLEAAHRRPVRDEIPVAKRDVRYEFRADRASVVTPDLLITTERHDEYKGGAASTKTVTTVRAERAWEPVGPVRAGSGPRDNRGVSQLNTPRSRP